jgi:DNA-binding transcriptional MerR regulator
MLKNEFFTAEEVARKLGISKQTLFRYEKKEIFPHPRRNRINRWRQYTEEDINKLKGIMRGAFE